MQEECDDLHVTDEDDEIIDILYTCTDTLLWKVSKLYEDYGRLDFQQLFQQTKQKNLKYWLRDFEDNVVVFLLFF